MKKIPIYKGEIAIVNRTKLSLVVDKAKTKLKFGKGPSEDTAEINLSMTLQLKGDINKIIIAKEDGFVEVDDDTSLGIFDFVKNNFFSDGALNNISLLTGSDPGEVRLQSSDRSIVLITDAEKREHGHSVM